MTDRILKIIEAKGVNSSRFAEMIGVQRSSISHLVAGRNKPSLEFLNKILKRFPDINPEWLFSGSGEMFRNGADQDNLPGKELIRTKERQDKSEATEISEKRRKEVKKTLKRPENQRDHKNIEKLVVFYDDKSFREYRPE